MLPLFKSIVSRISCIHERRKEIIWTYPGSGHDSLILGIVRELLVMNPQCRLLICFPGSAGIINFLVTLDGNPCFDDILVLNNNLDLENNNTLKNMSLENKSQDLHCCLALWKSWITEMKCLLNLSAYYHKRCPDPDLCTICSNMRLLNFSLISFRIFFDDVVVLLQNCLKYMIDQLSTICLLNHDVDNAKELLNMISQFENQLHNNILTDGIVQTAFGLVDVRNDIIDDDTGNELNETRLCCLKLIDSLMTSLTLPRLESRKEIEEFCIMHSRVVISTPDCASQLRGVKMKPFQALIVGHAGLMSENELLIPLNVSPRHVVLLGDHRHLQPLPKSKLCEGVGFGKSLFERLQHSSPKIHMLRKQFKMSPSIIQFPNECFYDGRIEKQ